MRSRRRARRWIGTLVAFGVGTGQACHAEIPVTVRQLIVGAGVLRGRDLVVEVVFDYIASVQDRPSWLKCTVEGKFRVTGAEVDTDVLPNVYLSPGASLTAAHLLTFGQKLTLYCRIVRADRRLSVLEVTRVKDGWTSEEPPPEITHPGPGSAVAP